MTDRRSEALVLYLGQGITPYPQRRAERLVERFGPELAPDLVQYAEGVLATLYAVQPDWSAEDLDGAADRAVAAVARQHPELDDASLAALRWSFTWDWK